MSAKHTPTPWHLHTYQNGRTAILNTDYVTKDGSKHTVIADMVHTGQEKDNAELIVLAVNSHAVLLEASKKMLKVLNGINLPGYGVTAYLELEEAIAQADGGAIMKTKTINVYQYSELSDRAKEKARDWYLQGEDFSHCWEYVQEDAKRIGLIIASLDQHRANSGRFEKFAEDTAERILKEHGETCETYKTAKSYLDALKTLKRDEDGELYLQEQDRAAELESEFLNSILEDYRIMLEKHIEYNSSEELIAEMMEANEYEFDENGKRI